MGESIRLHRHCNQCRQHPLGYLGVTDYWKPVPDDLNVIEGISQLLTFLLLIALPIHSLGMYFVG